MQYNSTSQSGGFTLLVILGVIGFLLVLLTGIYKVVLFELQDTKNMDYYVKSKSAAEAGQEIAMLKLKEKGFGYVGEESYDTDGESTMLTRNPLDSSKFHPNKDVFFGYEIDSESKDYDGVISASDFQIIPLFYITDDTAENDVEGSTKRITFSINGGDADSLVWNIIGDQGGISGKGAFNYSTSSNLKTIVDGGLGTQGFQLQNIQVEDFLQLGKLNYLTIFNVSGDNIEYNIFSNDGISFTKPITHVYSSAKIGEIKQNIKLTIDNSKYFDVLKYSIYDF